MWIPLLLRPQKEEITSEETKIAYQNKDITAKFMGDHLAEKSFAVYGLNVPRIVRVASCPRIRMLVIYTADVRPDQASSNLDAGCLQLEIEQAFLTGLDSAAVEAELREKIIHKVPLTGEDQMRFIILPLTLKGTSAKQECIRRCFDMAKDIEDEQTQVFLLSGLLTFSDKVITVNDSIMIQEWIKMTKVGRLFELERLESVKQAELTTARDIAARMLQNGDTVEKVVRIVTLLSREEIAALQERIEIS